MKKVYVAVGVAIMLMGRAGAASAQVVQETVVSGSNPYMADPETAAKALEAGTHWMTGAGLLRQHKADAAILEFNKAREIWPEVGVENDMAAAYTLKGEYQKAIAWYRKTIYPEPGHYKSQTDPVPLMRYAILLSKTGQREEAATIYNQALKCLPSLVRADRLPVDLPVQTPQYDDRMFEATARVVLASTYLVSFDKEALEEVDKAIQLQPKLAIARLYRGDILSRDPKKSDEAAQEYTNALRYKPSLRPQVEQSLKSAPKGVQAKVVGVL